MPEEPEKCDPAAIQLKFCMPDGNRPMRRFLGTHCIKVSKTMHAMNINSYYKIFICSQMQHVTSFVASQESICNPRGRFVIRLANTLPPQPLDISNPQLHLQTLGLPRLALLYVEEMVPINYFTNKLCLYKNCIIYICRMKMSFLFLNCQRSRSTALNHRLKQYTFFCMLMLHPYVSCAVQFTAGAVSGPRSQPHEFSAYGCK